DRDASVARQAIRQLGERRVREAVPILLPMLHDADYSLRFRAATALGRIGDTDAIAALLEALDQNDLFPRYAAFKALNRIGLHNPSSWPAILSGLQSNKSAIREGTTFAVRETWDPQLLAALDNVARATFQSTAARESALRLASALHRQKAPWRGEW